MKYQVGQLLHWNRENLNELYKGKYALIVKVVERSVILEFINKHPSLHRYKFSIIELESYTDIVS